jgi:hypothetical protein
MQIIQFWLTLREPIAVPISHAALYCGRSNWPRMMISNPLDSLHGYEISSFSSTECGFAMPMACGAHGPGDGACTAL